MLPRLGAYAPRLGAYATGLGAYATLVSHRGSFDPNNCVVSGKIPQYQAS